MNKKDMEIKNIAKRLIEEYETAIEEDREEEALQDIFSFVRELSI